VALMIFLIANIDELKGFPEAVAKVFPKTEIQLCVVHQCCQLRAKSVYG